MQAQRLQYESRTAKLLSAAIERSLSVLEKPQAGHEALAQLALAEDNITEARHWAEVGLKQQPMSASLARLVESLDGDQPVETLPPADGVLAVIEAEGASDASSRPREAAA